MSKQIIIKKDKRFKPKYYTITCGDKRRFFYDTKELYKLLIKFLKELE